MTGLSVGRSNHHEELPDGSGGSDRHNRKPADATNWRMRRMNCPLCNRRLFDVSKGIVSNMGIKIKCPHCHRIVTVNIRSTAI